MFCSGIQSKLKKKINPRFLAEMILKKVFMFPRRTLLISSLIGITILERMIFQNLSARKEKEEKDIFPPL